MYTLSDLEILDIVERAVKFGIEANGNKQEAFSIQIGAFWIEGYIAGNKNLTEADVNSLRNTIKNYYFY